MVERRPPVGVFLTVKKKKVQHRRHPWVSKVFSLKNHLIPSQWREENVYCTKFVVSYPAAVSQSRLYFPLWNHLHDSPWGTFPPHREWRHNGDTKIDSIRFTSFVFLNRCCYGDLPHWAARWHFRQFERRSRWSPTVKILQKRLSHSAGHTSDTPDKEACVCLFVSRMADYIGKWVQISGVVCRLLSCQLVGCFSVYPNVSTCNTTHMSIRQQKKMKMSKVVLFKDHETYKCHPKQGCQ